MVKANKLSLNTAKTYYIIFHGARINLPDVEKSFSNYNKDFHLPSEYIFRELQGLPLYNHLQNRNSFMMFKLVSGLLPEIMSALCIVNYKVHAYFTIQSYLLHTEKGRKHVFIQSFRKTGPRIWNSTQNKR